jgi:hypothetical protein
VVAPPVVDGIVHAVVYGKGYGVDEFREAQAQAKRPGTAGWWDRVIPELSEEQRKSLEQAGADRGISHRTISVVLGRWGFEVTPAMVGHWRRNHVG